MSYHHHANMGPSMTSPAGNNNPMPYPAYTMAAANNMAPAAVAPYSCHHDLAVILVLFILLVIILRSTEFFFK
ncbi:hypothetical protein [Paenibacillus sp. y28]|uniref:hypothetical protein n=1 Tax=Paenibacillus sp. y28 TaxID=3129110 RepID=UPI003019A296